MKETTRFFNLIAKEKRGKYHFESKKKTEDDISFLCNYWEKSSAMAIFTIGELLTTLKNNVKHGEFLKFLESKKFPFKYNTAARYMQLYNLFKEDPSELEGFGYREALIYAGIIKPKYSEESGTEGYNRLDLGGDIGQGQLDFGELFKLPSTSNRSLINYRTLSSDPSEIIVVRRNKDDTLVSKRIVQFFEDVPEHPVLNLAYKTMSKETQASVEKYLLAFEQVELENK